MSAEYLSYAATACFVIGVVVIIAGFRVEALHENSYQFLAVGLGALLKTLAIGVTCVQNVNHFFSSPAEICGLMAWALACAHLLGLAVSGARSLGALVVPLIVVLMVFSHVLSSQGPDPGAHGGTFAAHILCAFLGYALFLTSSGASVLYLEQNRLLKRKAFGVIFRDMPSLERLERLEVLCARLGLLLFTFALTSGAALMYEQHRTFWLEPKFIAAQLTWIVFVVLVVGRALRWIHGRRLAKVGLVGAALVLLTFALWHPWAPPGTARPVNAFLEWGP